MSDHSTTPSNKDTSHCTDVAEFLRILIEPENVFEVRSIRCPEKPGGTFVSTAAGWFNDIEPAAIGVEHIEARRPPACYVTLNPVRLALLARGLNRVTHNVKSTTSDDDIVRRRWLFVDIDARRPAGVSSTDCELLKASELSDTLLAAMSTNGWPEPLEGMSGNGRYLLWRIDLPNDEESKLLVQTVLKTMASQFDTIGAEVDCSTFNAARICKVLGSVARKGDALVGIEGIENRPHRQSWFIKPNVSLKNVTVEQLRALVASAEPEPAVVSTPKIGTPHVLSDKIERARSYLALMEPAIQGEKGSNKLLAAANAMVKGFDLSTDDAMQLLESEYNNRCTPLWTEKELLHKVAAANKCKNVRGYLLGAHAADKPWPDPTALPNPNPLPAVMTYSSDLLPDSVGRAINDIAERMQCPPDFPAAAMLVALAALIGCRIGIRPRRFDNWLVVPNLWGCVVGRPALKKSQAIQTAEGEIRAIETRERERLAPAIQNAGIDALMAEWRIKGLKAGITRALRDGDDTGARGLAETLRTIEERRPPVPRRIITTDATIEKLCDMLNEHPSGMLLWVDELVGWMRALDRHEKAGVRQQFLTLWNGQGRLNIDRIGRGETVVESPCLGLFGCCTPGGLSDYVTAAKAGGRGDDGLLQRLQVTVWPDPPTVHIPVDRFPDFEAQRNLRAVFESFADLAPSTFGGRDEFDSGEIPWLRFDDAGQAIFDAWDSSLQNRLRSMELPEAVESHLSKYASMVPSIALVLHLASGGRGAVSAEAASTAVRWATYLESHANRLYSITAAPEQQAALPLLRRLIDWPSDQPIRVRTIRERGWALLREPNSIMEALKLLIDFGWVRAKEFKPELGRPTIDYLLHPNAKEFLDSARDETPTIVTPQSTQPPSTFEGFAGSTTGEQSNTDSSHAGVQITVEPNVQTTSEGFEGSMSGDLNPNSALAGATLVKRPRNRRRTIPEMQSCD